MLLLVCVLPPQCGCFACVRRAEHRMAYYRNALSRSCVLLYETIKTEAETANPGRDWRREWPPRLWARLGRMLLYKNCRAGRLLRYN